MKKRSQVIVIIIIKSNYSPLSTSENLVSVKFDLRTLLHHYSIVSSDIFYLKVETRIR